MKNNQDSRPMISSMTTWITSIIWGSPVEGNAMNTPVVPGEAYYQVSGGRRLRSSSFHVDSKGVAYETAEEIGRGRGGSVRLLKKIGNSDPDDGPTLVVKKNLDHFQIKPTDLQKSKDFLCLVYPQLAEYVQVFDPEDQKKARLVMPKLGEKTLGRILCERGRSLNNRYAHCVKALEKLIDLREKQGIFHNDAHAGNILFDQQGHCFLIDAEYFFQLDRTKDQQISKCFVDRDLGYFTSVYKGNLSGLVTQFMSADWDNVYHGSKHYPGHITLGLNDKKNIITYYVIDLNGESIRNTITRDDCQTLLNESDYNKICQTIFHADLKWNTGATQLQECLPIILEITSKRGETIRDSSTYFSENFLTSIFAARSLTMVKNTFISEMQKNHDIVLNLIREVHEDLSGCVSSMLNVSPLDAERLALLNTLQAKLVSMNVNDNVPFSQEIVYQKTDEMLHELIDSLYQLERISAVRETGYSSYFMLKRPSKMHETSKPTVDKIREDLRCSLVHLPEVLLSRDAVLKSPLNLQSNILGKSG